MDPGTPRWGTCGISMSSFPRGPRRQRHRWRGLLARDRAMPLGVIGTAPTVDAREWPDGRWTRVFRDHARIEGESRGWNGIRSTAIPAPAGQIFDIADTFAQDHPIDGAGPYTTSHKGRQDAEEPRRDRPKTAG
jgi:hypothetical protein